MMPAVSLLALTQAFVVRCPMPWVLEQLMTLC